MSKNADLLAKVRTFEQAKTDHDIVEAIEGVIKVAHVERKPSAEEELKKMLSERVTK